MVVGDAHRDLVVRAEIAKASSAVTVEVGVEPTGGVFDCVLLGRALVRGPELVDDLLGEGGSPWT